MKIKILKKQLNNFILGIYKKRITINHKWKLIYLLRKKFILSIKKFKKNQILLNLKNIILKKEIYLNKLLKNLIKYKDQKTFFKIKIKDQQKIHKLVLINNYHRKLNLKTFNDMFNHLILVINHQFIQNKSKEPIMYNKKFIKDKFKNKEIKN